MDRVRKIEILELTLSRISYVDFGICNAAHRLADEGIIYLSELSDIIEFLEENRPDRNSIFKIYYDNEYWLGSNYWWNSISKHKPGTLGVRKQYLAELIKHLKES